MKMVFDWPEVAAMVQKFLTGEYGVPTESILAINGNAHQESDGTWKFIVEVEVKTEKGRIGSYR